MRNIFTVFKRELKSYFVTPIAYVVGLLFIVIGSIFFYSYIKSTREAKVEYLGYFIWLVILFCPILTIKLISEEKNQGTIELLMTSPITSLQLVLGKYFAALCMFTIILLITLIHILLIIIFGNNVPDIGATFAGYLGVFFMGSAMLGIGVVVSAVSDNQAVAALLGIGISFSFLLLNYFSQDAGQVIKTIIKEITLTNHYEDFWKGIINIKDVIYYILWAALCILLANKSVERYVWKS